MVDKEMLTAMEELLERKLDEKLDQKFDENLKPVNIKLDRLETSVKKLDERTTSLETSVIKLETSVEKLGERTTGLEMSVSRLETSVEKLDERTAKLETDMNFIKVVQLENNVIPRLNTIEKCYLDTSKRYLERTEQIDRMDSDISILKQIVTNHSEKLKKAQ